MRPASTLAPLILLLATSSIASEFQSSTAIEATVQGRQKMCGVEFSDAEPANSPSPHFFKAAIRQYKIDGQDLVEFYVDAGTVLRGQKQYTTRRVPVNHGWIRTQDDLGLLLSDELRTPNQDSYQVFTIEQTNTALLKAIAAGKSITIGFNLNDGAYDKSFTFSPALSEEKRENLVRCMQRLERTESKAQ